MPDLYRVLTGRRTAHRWNGHGPSTGFLAHYLTQRGELAPGAGQLASLFREPTPQGQFNRAGQQSLLVFATELVHRRTPLCP
ncbi:hypothetical protein ACWGDS_20960 [Streptomyces sp. NPDC055059]|uniref:hypothetical protein n=1 Tax=Streptomyces sp. NPDC127172 TaxID=3345382 RepID=UPI003626BE40